MSKAIALIATLWLLLDAICHPEKTPRGLARKYLRLMRSMRSMQEWDAKWVWAREDG